ncbi:MerR family transcriptional regulator [Rhodococcus sp. GXMU-t2271]|uniref:DNA polymerase III subunit beta family protein n=1 Tax=Rhodococcus sp. GXMU-t2271 TaxID=3059079 RepID=UPI00352AE0B2
MTPSPDLITIGIMARLSGLTPGALRFYGDCRLLVPAMVDPVTGYRYYTVDQRERAVTIRQLRELDVPLEDVGRILDGDAESGAALLDEHVAELHRRAERATRLASAVKSRLTALAAPLAVAVPGRLLADTVERVLPSIATDPKIPCLTGILVEVNAGTVVLTATNRYRLTTGSVTAAVRTEDPFRTVADSSALRGTAMSLREHENVGLALDDSGALTLTGADGERHSCPAVEGTFPDYRSMLAALTPPVTRVIVHRDALAGAVRDAAAGTIDLRVRATALTVGHGRHDRVLPADVTGADLDLAFDRDGLGAALDTAVGPEVVLDIASYDRPVVIRSAAAGDLTTLAMPVRREERP